MGMPRKGSRVVKLDDGPHKGREFRWMLASGRLTDDDDGSVSKWNAGTLTLQEEADRPGHVLQVDLKWFRGDSVTPEIVREVIRRALAAGWDPSSRKAPKSILGSAMLKVPLVSNESSV